MQQCGKSIAFSLEKLFAKGRKKQDKPYYGLLQTGNE